MINLLSSITKAVSEFFSFSKHRSEQNNTEEMKNAERATNEVKFKNTAEKAVTDKDIENIRNNIAE